MTERLNSDPEIAISMQSLVDYTTVYAAFLPLQFHQRIAEESGAHGLEFFPWRAVDLQVRMGGVVNTDNIISAHQSFRSEAHIFEPLAKRHFLGILAVVSLPHMDSSLNTLRYMHRISSSDLPFVLYTRDNGITPAPDLKPSLFQPTAAHLLKINLDNPRQYLKNHGFDGFCIDTLHIRRPERKNNQTITPPSWKESIPALLPYTNVIHISAGRSDIQQNVVPTMNELKDLYSGTSNTEIFDILNYIKNYGWKGKFVTEVPARSLAVLKNRKFLTPRELAETNKRIISNIRSALN